MVALGSSKDSMKTLGFALGILCFLLWKYEKHSKTFRTFEGGGVGTAALGLALIPLSQPLHECVVNQFLKLLQCLYVFQ